MFEVLRFAEVHQYRARERVRQLGNAVTPPAARDLIAALVEAINGAEIA